MQKCIWRRSSRWATLPGVALTILLRLVPDVEAQFGLPDGRVLWEELVGRRPEIVQVYPSTATCWVFAGERAKATANWARKEVITDPLVSVDVESIPDGKVVMLKAKGESPMAMARFRCFPVGVNPR